ncbi:24245_t:CDS:2 [Cetraspora pellucida]|uniref:24245_t:CDS:1 n=1 Tax=Cetraspora pellucida TaxID=1433469 RepID=A0A9N8ZIX3_9GLOM|nr:24245_t:CDS:2 [Cetraspora pellucida]
MPHATETLNSSTSGASILSSLPIPIPNTSTDDNSSTVNDQDLYVGYSTDGASFTSPPSDSHLKVLEINHCRDNMCCDMDHGNLHDLLQHIDISHPELKVVDGNIFPFDTSTVYTQLDNGFHTFNTAPIGFVHPSMTNSPHSPITESKSILNISDDFNYHTYIDYTPSSVMSKQKWCPQNLCQGNVSQDDKSCDSDTDLRISYQYPVLYENKSSLNPSNFSINDSTYIRDQASSNSSSISTSYDSSPHAFQMNADQDQLLSAVQSPLMSYPPTPIDATDSSTFLRSATSSPTNSREFSSFIQVLDNQSSILTSSPPSSTTVPTSINNRQQNSSIITKSNDTKPSLNNYNSFNISDYYISRPNGPIRSQTTPPSSSTPQSDQRRRRSLTANLNSNDSDTSQQNSYVSRSSPNVNDDKSNNQRATIYNQRRASSSLEDSNLLVNQQPYNISNFVSSQRSESVDSDPDFSQPGASTTVVSRDQHRQLPSSSTVDPNLLVGMNEFISTNTNYLQSNPTSSIAPLQRSSSDSKNYMTVRVNSSSNDPRVPCTSGSFQKTSSSTDNTTIGSYLPPVATSPYSTDDPTLPSSDGFSQGKKFSKKRSISTDARSCKRRVSKSLETPNISSVTVLTSDVSLITETSGGLSSDDVNNHPYRCPVPDCTKAYKNANGLKYHNEHGHTSSDGARQKPWPCRVENCHKTYGSKGGLIYHVNRNHPNDLWALP